MWGVSRGCLLLTKRGGAEVRCLQKDRGGWGTGPQATRRRLEGDTRTVPNAIAYGLALSGLSLALLRTRDMGYMPSKELQSSRPTF